MKMLLLVPVSFCAEFEIGPHHLSLSNRFLPELARHAAFKPRVGSQRVPLLANMILQHKHSHVAADAVCILAYPLKSFDHPRSQIRVRVIELRGIVPGREVWVAPEGDHLARRV